MQLLNIDKIIDIKGSKSILNRIIMLVSYCKHTVKVSNWSRCSDILTMERNLTSLGFKFSFNDRTCTITPPTQLKNNQELFIEDSATGLRFLLTRLAFEPRLHTVIRMSPQLQQRPHSILIEILRELGASITILDNGYEIHGVEFVGGYARIKGDVSSQYISALLLLAAGNTSSFRLDMISNLVSFSYIELTLEILKQCGVFIEHRDKGFSIDGNHKLKVPDSFDVEPDASSAAFWLAAGAINLGKIKIVGLHHKSIQPDAVLLKILRDLGASVRFEGDYVVVQNKTLLGGKFDLSNNPDLVPMLSILGLFCDKPLILNGIAHLRYKESNRLDRLAEELKKCGADINSTENALSIQPLKKTVPEVTLNTCSDHRMVMAYTLLKMVYPQILLSENESVKKSYPEFFDDIGNH